MMFFDRGVRHRAGVLGEDLGVVLAAADAVARSRGRSVAESSEEKPGVGAHQPGRVGGAVLGRVDRPASRA